MKAQDIRQHRLTRNAAYLTIAQFAKFVARGLYVLILARYLGPELFGILNYAHSWYLLFLPIAVFGMQTVMARELGRKQTPDLLLIRSSLALRLGLTAGACLISLTLSWSIEAHPVARELLLVLIVALAGRSLSLWSNTVNVSLERAAPVLYIETLFRLWELVAAALIVFAGYGLIELAWVHVASYWLEAAVYLVLLSKRFPVLTPRWDYTTIRMLLHLGFWSALALASQGWVYQAPIVLLRWLAGLSEQLGHVSLLMQGITIIAVIPFMVNRALLPRLSREDQHWRSRSRLYLGLFVGYGSVIALFVALATQWFAEPLVIWLFGVQYSPVGEMLVPIMWGMLPLLWGLAAQQLLLAKGYYVANAVLMLFSALSITLLIWLLYPYMDSAAVSLAYPLTMLGWSALSWLAIYRYDVLRSTLL